MQPSTPSGHAAADINGDSFYIVIANGHYPQEFVPGDPAAASDTGSHRLVCSHCHRRYLSHRLRGRITRT